MSNVNVMDALKRFTTAFVTYKFALQMGFRTENICINIQVD